MAATVPNFAGHALPRAAPSTFYEKLNSQWHERALWVFMAVVLAHWGEHLAQAYQIWIMGWPVSRANGILGLWYPWLIQTETLHYGYALVMLIGLWVLRKGFTGRSRIWWNISLVIQFWHHFEHLLLLIQATIHHNLMGKPVPYSIIQLFIPRVQLHLFYNAIVFVPMVIAMYYHMFPPLGEAPANCTCSWYTEETGQEADCRA